MTMKKHPAEKITQEDLTLAEEAKAAFERMEPPVFAADIDKWDTAKREALTRHGVDSTVFWPACVAIYRRIAGKFGTPVMASDVAATGLPKSLGESIQATGLAVDVSDAPEWLMYAPGGTHEIKASKAGKPFKCTVQIEQSTASVLQASLNKINSEWHPQKAFLDFDHEGKRAAAWPIQFQWRDQPEPGVFCKVEWSDAGRKAVLGKDYRSFSPSFFSDGGDPARMTGIDRISGSLVNAPAFRKISPLWCKEDDTPQHDGHSTPVDPPPSSIAPAEPKPVAANDMGTMSGTKVLTDKKDTGREHCPDCGGNISSKDGKPYCVKCEKEKRINSKLDETLTEMGKLVGGLETLANEIKAGDNDTCPECKGELSVRKGKPYCRKCDEFVEAAEPVLSFDPKHLTDDDRQYGAMAKVAAASRQTASWVENEDLWVKATQAADKGDYGDDHWPIVVRLYRGLGGEINASEPKTPIESIRRFVGRVVSGHPHYAARGSSRRFSLEDVLVARNGEPWQAVIRCNATQRLLAHQFRFGQDGSVVLAQEDARTILPGYDRSRSLFGGKVNASELPAQQVAVEEAPAKESVAPVEPKAISPVTAGGPVTAEREEARQEPETSASEPKQLSTTPIDSIRDSIRAVISAHPHYAPRPSSMEVNASMVARFTLKDVLVGKNGEPWQAVIRCNATQRLLAHQFTFEDGAPVLAQEDAREILPSYDRQRSLLTGKIDAGELPAHVQVEAVQPAEVPEAAPSTPPKEEPSLEQVTTKAYETPADRILGSVKTAVTKHPHYAPRPSSPAVNAAMVARFGLEDVLIGRNRDPWQAVVRCSVTNRLLAHPFTFSKDGAVVLAQEDAREILPTYDRRRSLLTGKIDASELPAHVQAGDAPGHPFRGNQHSDGGASEPEIEHEGQKYHFNADTKRWHDRKGEPVSNSGLHKVLDEKAEHINKSAAPHHYQVGEKTKGDIGNESHERFVRRAKARAGITSSEPQTLSTVGDLCCSVEDAHRATNAIRDGVCLAMETHPHYAPINKVHRFKLYDITMRPWQAVIHDTATELFVQHPFTVKAGEVVMEEGDGKITPVYAADHTIFSDRVDARELIALIQPKEEVITK